MILLYRLFPCCKWKYCINPRADSVTCCAGAAHSNSSSPSFLQFSAKCFKIVEKMTALSLFYNSREKRDFWSPSENSTSGSPCRFIMRRTFGSRCWGGGSGEETHGEVGCVGSARFKNHSTKKKKTRDVDAFSQSARSSPQSPFKLETQVVTTHQWWERRSDLIAAACSFFISAAARRLSPTQQCASSSFPRFLFAELPGAFRVWHPYGLWPNNQHWQRL